MALSSVKRRGSMQWAKRMRANPYRTVTLKTTTEIQRNSYAKGASTLFVAESCLVKRHHGRSCGTGYGSTPTAAWKASLKKLASTKK